MAAGLLAGFPIAGFLVAFVLARWLGRKWSSRLCMLLSLCLPVGLVMALSNRTFETGMLGALIAVLGTMVALGAWLGHSWGSRALRPSESGTGLSGSQD
jgi:hypothetical protein